MNLLYILMLLIFRRCHHILGSAGTPPQGNEVLPGFGRLWVADFDSDKSTIYWSDLLDGTVWTDLSGSIDVSKVWPNGYDEIVALSAHNGFLVIFGKDSILVYEGADSPSTMTLADTISNIGCVSRRQKFAKTDIWIALVLGVWARTIQEKSSPIGDISKNVNNDVKNLVASETGNISLHYSPKEAFVLLTSLCYRLFMSLILGFRHRMGLIELQHGQALHRFVLPI